jgi:hypothetical protein
VIVGGRAPGQETDGAGDLMAELLLTAPGAKLIAG